MTELRVTVPDETAERLANEAAERGTSAEDVAADVLEQHTAASKTKRFGFIGLFDGPVEVSVAEAERRLEDGEYKGLGRYPK